MERKPLFVTAPGGFSEDHPLLLKINTGVVVKMSDIPPLDPMIRFKANKLRIPKLDEVVAQFDFEATASFTFPQ